MTVAKEDLLKQIEFIKEIDKIKYIQRRTKLINSNRCENDAEYSWHLAMMTLILAEHSNEPIDVLKVIKMVLIHDIVEIDAGDTLFMIHKRIIQIRPMNLKLQKEYLAYFPLNNGMN